MLLTLSNCEGKSTMLTFYYTHKSINPLQSKAYKINSLYSQAYNINPLLTLFNTSIQISGDFNDSWTNVMPIPPHQVSPGWGDKKLNMCWSLELNETDKKVWLWECNLQSIMCIHVCGIKLNCWLLLVLHCNPRIFQLGFQKWIHP